MNLFFTLIATIFVFKVHAFQPGLLEQGRKMVGLIEEARRCSIDYQSNTYKMNFCSGMVLEKDDLNFLSGLSMKGCRQFLVQRGYQVHIFDNGKKNIQGVNQSTIDEFFNSTKLAWMLHKEKQILFKNNANRGDCLHEVLHFYQRERKTSSPLAPLNRKKAEARLQALLEKAVLKVEKVEKKGDKKKASEMASKLQPFIALQREWQKMINWLDEKEIYQAFFDYNSVFFKGDDAKRDWDIALANLVRLKDSLSWDLRERVLFEAQTALNKKYLQVKTPRTLKGQKSEEYYGTLYNQGKISRNDFEVKVIGLRKYKATQEVVKARQKGDLLATLVARAKLRNFQKEAPALKSNPAFEIKYDTYKELPMVLVEGEPFIIDTGASESVMPPNLLKKYKEKDISLLGSKVLQTVVGRTQASPIIQLLKPITIAGKKYKGLTFVVNKLPIKGVSGILGMDFFERVNGGLWHWRPKKRTLGPLTVNMIRDNLKDKDIQQRILLPNGRGVIDAIEFRCGKIKVRLDSGSQVLGDIPSGAKYTNCEKKFGLGKDKHKALLQAPAASALFSREVGLNLGYEFFKELDAISLNLPKKEINWKM